MGARKKKTPGPIVLVTDRVDREPEHKVSKYQRYRMGRVHRSDFRAAPYNPRYQDPYARRELEEVIKTMGLISPPTLNERTGNIVGAHQRLDLLDGLHGGTDYYLDACIVDMDEAEEMRANLALNNKNLQGEFDIAKLADCYRQSGAEDFRAAGFSETDLHAMFDGTTFANNLFAVENQAPQVAEDLAALRAIAQTDVSAATAGGMGPPADGKVASLTDRGKAEESVPERETKEDTVKRHREEFKAATAARNEDAATDFTVIVVCADSAERMKLLAALGLPTELRMIDSRRVLFKLGALGASPL